MNRAHSIIAAALALASLWVFSPALDAPFLHDDDAYLVREPMVHGGLRSAAFVWMLTASHSGNWHPLTTLAHTAMCHVFGTEPRAHHALNLALHAANAALCFLVFRRLTARRWPSLFVAAVFALHPLRVESVAWVAELKDLLCALFWLLALLAYARRNRALMIAATVAALLSKPMAVTLPLTLLLLDAWPLRRWPARPWLALVREKAWLFALCALHSAVTIAVQWRGGAGDFAERVPTAARIGNALVCMLEYVRKFFWPSDLAALYPHPIWWPAAQVLTAAFILSAISVAAWRWRKSAPWVLTGWLWFLLTLAPVLGFIQVGVQAMADRYTYIPALGLAFAVAWSAALLPRGLVICVVLVPLTFVTQTTLSRWRDPVVLFEHALRVADRPTLIRYWLATALHRAGRSEEAVAQLQTLLREDPAFVQAHLPLAALLAKLDRPTEAAAVLREAVARAPESWQTWNNLGWWLTAEDADFAEAGATLHRAEALAPDWADVQINLGYWNVRAGRPAEAETHYRRAVQFAPWNAGAHRDLAHLLELRGATQEARPLRERAGWIEPP